MNTRHGALATAFTVGMLLIVAACVDAGEEGNVPEPMSSGPAATADAIKSDVPICPTITVFGVNVCLPEGASYGMLGPSLCTEAQPCEAAVTTTVTFNGSVIKWRTVTGKDGAAASAIIDWTVSPAHDSGFAELRAALESAGLAIPGNG